MTNVVDVDTPITITLSYDQEGERRLSAPKRVEFVVTPALARTFARAAAFNKRDSTPLSFTSLLVAMLTGTDPIAVWLKREFGVQSVTVDRVAARKTDPFDEGSLRQAETGYAALPVLATSISARRAIEEGQAIAASLDRNSVLDLRHIVAAYPILREWHDGDFANLGIDRLAWCRALGARMAAEYVVEKWYWRGYVDRAAPVPLTSFSADVYDEKDLLGIDRSVDALALLIASTRTDTPLAIGVFGPWGSGKSFFMRHLRRRIWSLAEREQRRVSAWRQKRKEGSAKPDDAPLYYGQVAQVEFNAWHYNEGNLVASLVDHLFRNLRVLPGTKDTELEERQKDVLVKIAGAKGDVQTAVQEIGKAQTSVKEAQDEVAQAKQDVAAVHQTITEKTAELTKWTDDSTRARDQVDAAIRELTLESNDLDPAALFAVAMRPLTESPAVADVRAAGQELTNAVADWRRFASRLCSPLGIGAAALLLAAPILALLTNWFSDSWAAITAAVTAATATLAPVIKWMRERREQFEKKMTEIERETSRRHDEQRHQLEANWTQVQKEWDRKIGSLRASLEGQQTVLKERETTAAAAIRTLADKTKDLDAKVEQRANAEMKLRELEAELQRLSSALLLDEFIKDRARTDEYRKQLSFLALVRRDFERLSDLIAAANADWCAHDKATDPPLLNRIVLYIDDLDRCNVDTVLRVLEAVHLLLAFPLFVCVVAVDPRWIEECLRQKHDHLFGIKAQDGEKREDDENAHVTVGDYLEKIFQIPIWMRPIEGRQRSAVVKSLLGATAAPPPRAATGERRGEDEGRRNPDSREAQSEAGDGFQEVVNKAMERPDPLRITPEEAEFVDAVGDLLSDKPRALKRFVNTYRLLKASLPDLDQQGFVTTGASSPHRICISQLAFFTGQPRLAASLVAELEHAGPTLNDSVSLSEWLESLPLTPRSRLVNVVGRIPDAASMTMDRFCEWLPLTSKYLFHRNDGPARTVPADTGGAKS
jgi:KAP-like P-loop domain-containing protein